MNDNFSLLNFMHMISIPDTNSLFSNDASMHHTEKISWGYYSIHEVNVFHYLIKLVDYNIF